MGKDGVVQKLVNEFDAWPKQSGPAQNRAGAAGKMTDALYPYETMFSPIQVNKTTLKNRIVMAPMGNIDMCEETGRPNDKMLHYFFARAKGGAGLLTTGLIPTSFGVDPSITELGRLSYFPRIDRSRTVLCGWRDLAQGVHAFGSKIFVQLTPGLGRVGNPQCMLTQAKLPVSASFNPNFYISAIPCVRLSGAKLQKIVKNTGQAAADSHAMGLDGVYLHGHEGYLLEQMTNPAFNRRKIGRYADWQRFGVDLIREIRKRVGPHYPIMYRIDLSLALEETYDESVLNGTFLKKFKHGRTVDMTLAYMEELVKAGVDMFDVDLGCYDNWWLPHPPSSMPAGCFVPVAKLVKEHFAQKGIRSNAGVPVPVVAVGKLGYPDIAEQALRDGACDMVMLGRPLLADPEWPNKAYAGKVQSIRPCIGCQEGCLNEFVEGGHPQCAVNPRTAFEHVLPQAPAAAEKPKRVAVVGAGPGGVVAAVSAAARGHKVDLYEKTEKIGGRIVPGGVPKIKFDIENYRLYLEREVEQAQQGGNLKFHPGTEVSAAGLAAQGYDAIIFAVGTRQVDLKLPGVEQIATVQATDLFLQPERIGAAQNIVVVGGGVVGCEAAQWLACEHHRSVTVVEMLPQFMEGTCTANRGHLIHALKGAGVRLMNCTKVSGFGAGKVTVSRNHHKNVPNPYNTWAPILPENIENPLAPKLGQAYQDETLEADLVVFAAGGRADDALFFEAQRTQAAAELYNIGDSFAPGKVQEAVRAAYRLGTSI
ncbi:MAG: FAD-dependent oxidoreductase [Christensenellaceae bacterium]|jgi:2-enoate reductase|nr:FAD-dependent oxidoreductase [Christensenellaceae bacterium]